METPKGLNAGMMTRGADGGRTRGGLLLASKAGRAGSGRKTLPPRAERTG